MKVRIGLGLGTRTPTNDDRFGPFVDHLERLRFDSLWLSERVTGEAPDPLIGLAVAAGRTRRLKLGTAVLVLPGRNPVLLAKELASLDRLSGGRLLPAVGLGAVDPREQQAFGVERSERAGWLDEALPLVRRLWAEDAVDHDGPRWHLRGASVLPRPVQQPIELWLGGIAPSELRRAGRLGDGWLPSFVTPADCAAGRPVVEEAAARAGRAIDPEHWGALVPYSLGPVPDGIAAFIRARRPDLEPTDLVPVGFDALRSHLGAFVDVGFSKFVVLPLAEPAEWGAHLAELAAAVLPLET
ncbi:MAG: LLM class flavin-dependent oxidoreductase [Acidimicrobiales bacterium]|nr:LLM class flavin-dependent oxidoreductase [Acidimicrobiales bacterium]